MGKRNIRNITELKGMTAECKCGCSMNILNYGSLYYGYCDTCGSETTTYHSAFAVKNEQHKKCQKLVTK